MKSWTQHGSFNSGSLGLSQDLADLTRVGLVANSWQHAPPCMNGRHRVLVGIPGYGRSSTARIRLKRTEPVEVRTPSSDNQTLPGCHIARPTTLHLPAQFLPHDFQHHTLEHDINRPSSSLLVIPLIEHPIRRRRGNELPRPQQGLPRSSSRRVLRIQPRLLRPPEGPNPARRAHLWRPFRPPCRRIVPLPSQTPLLLRTSLAGRHQVPRPDGGLSRPSPRRCPGL